MVSDWVRNGVDVVRSRSGSNGGGIFFYLRLLLLLLLQRGLLVITPNMSLLESIEVKERLMVDYGLTMSNVMKVHLDRLWVDEMVGLALVLSVGVLLEHLSLLPFFLPPL